MNPLEKFNQLFDQLQLEVTRLLKQKETLEQEVATKLARQTYLQDAIADLETKRTESEQATADTLAVNAERLVDAKQQLQQLQAEYDKVRAEVVAGEQKIATMQQVADAEMKRLDDAVKAKIQEKDRLIADIDQEVADKQQELQVVTTELTDSKQAAVVLDEQVSRKAEEVSSEIVKLDADLQIVQHRHQDVVVQLDNKQDELEQMQAKIDAAKLESGKLEVQKTSFKEYEARVTKALEAREEAVKYRETVLKQQERRRQSPATSVLDNS